MAILFAINEYNNRALRRERLYRDRLNPLEFYDDLEIKKLFRLECANILTLVDSLTDNLKHETGRSKSLSPLLQVCVALNYFATGLFQNEVGTIINVDQSTVSRSLHRVIDAILKVYSFEISFPTNTANY